MNKKLRESIKQAEKHPLHGSTTRRVVEAFGRENVEKLLARMQEGSFDWNNLREACQKAEQEGILRETVAESAFQALLRLGVETIIQKGYEIPETVWDQVMLTVNSNGLFQPYGYTFRSDLPQEVPNGAEFNESRVVPREIIVRNRKFGRLLSFERELFEDDQTGEINRKAQELGENMKQVEEIHFFGNLLGQAYTFGAVSVPAPTYNDPDGLPGVYNVSRGNRPAAYSALTQASFQAARQSLLTIKDPLGNLIAVNPNTLVVAPDLEYDASVLMNSSWYPTTVSPTSTGAPAAINPIQGMAVVKVCRWAKFKSWHLGQAKSRSLVYQLRTALEVVQEDPNAGKSFERDAYRYRVRKRWAMFWADSRFWFQGNDGSV